MYHENTQEETELPEINLDDIETTPEEDNSIAQELTEKELDSKITKIVDEKVALAQTSTDEEEELPEDEEDEGQSIGIFPFILIGGVALVAIGSIFLKNSPLTAPTSSEEDNRA